MRLVLFTQAVDKNDPVLGFFHAWLIEFAKHFDSISAVCLYEGPHELPSNIEVLSLGKEKGASKIVRVFRFYRYILSLRNEYDAVFVHMNPEYVVLGGVFWRLLGKRVVLWYTHKSVDLKLRLALLLAHRAATASKESFRIESPKVSVLGHGIDTDEFDAEGRIPFGQTLRIATVGRISPVKGYDTLVEAIASLKGIDLSLEIVGAPATEADKAYEMALKAKVKELGLSEKISFLGPVPHKDIPDILRRADAFVNLSGTGSLDKAVLEAMACGAIPLTSNEAFRDILGPFGLVFEKGSSADLASKLAGIAARGDSVAALGSRLREVVVREHNLRGLMGKIEALYV
ncbi:MAG: glycosyltransferase family 4 protein [Candidatus Taylorbacteria bacterium]|nr:glycosyltransferase family 4 protein [Candidatus Taylorbacteria bacterium]